MLSPIYRWVVEDWRDAARKRLLLLGAQLELRGARDFTALGTALEIGSAREVTALPPSRPRALPARLITTDPEEQSSWIAIGSSTSPTFWKTFPRPGGRDLSKLTLQIISKWVTELGIS